MNKELRRISIASLAMFVALFVSTSVIQVFEVDELRAIRAASLAVDDVTRPRQSGQRSQFRLRDRRDKPEDGQR